MIKKALIICIYGQDGFYLSNLLLKKKNYKVYGVSRIKKIKTRAKISNKVKIFTLKKNNDSRKLNKIFSYIKVDTFKHYLSNYNYFFSKKIIGNKNFKLIKNLDAVEIGQGLGFNLLLYSLYNKKLIFFMI